MYEKKKMYGGKNEKGHFLITRKSSLRNGNLSRNRSQTAYKQIFRHVSDPVAFLSSQGPEPARKQR